MNTPIEVALVGAGYIADIHLGFLRGMQSVRVVAIADVDPQRLAETAAKWRIPKTYASAEHMFRDARPAAVHVLTPPNTHARVAISALNAGCHALVEKPMALSVTECDAMIAAARTRGLTLGVVHNELFDPGIAGLRTVVERGEIGTPFHVDAIRGTAFQRGGTAPRAPWAYQSPVNLLYDIGPHPVYLARAILGEVRHVSAGARETVIDGHSVYDDWRILLSCDRGTAALAVSTAATPVQNCFTVFGTAGTLRADLMRMHLLKQVPSRLPSALARGLSSVEEAAQMVVQTGVGSIKWLTGHLRPYQGLGELVQRFYASLQAHAAPPVTAADGRATVAALEMIAAQMGVAQ